MDLKDEIEEDIKEQIIGLIDNRIIRTATDLIKNFE